ncbi:hypothetical protein EDB84DRAFT_1578199 [Lactarius hengduanensis]|nr:hypothetical protein EDB84DRAFT_1578199 [Lactarius hengduanensis]
MDDEQWLRLIHAFDGAKDFRLDDKLATDVLRALRPADEGHKIVLPALRYLHVQGAVMRGPSRDSVESFLAQRQLSNHPVQVYYDLPLRSPSPSLRSRSPPPFPRFQFSPEPVGGHRALIVGLPWVMELQRQQQELWQWRWQQRQEQQQEQQQERRRQWRRQQRQEQQQQRRRQWRR